MDIIGQVADDLQPFILHLEVIHTVSISVAGRSDAITIKREPVFNPGRESEEAEVVVVDVNCAFLWLLILVYPPQHSQFDYHLNHCHHQLSLLLCRHLVASKLQLI